MIKLLKHALIGQLSLLVLTSCDDRKPVENTALIDDFYEKCRKIVLSENEPGLEYFFKRRINEVDECEITYLGTIKTAKGRVLKFLTEVNYFGLYEYSKRANGSVCLYDAENKRIGRYYVGGASGIPAKIEGSKLVFSYNDQNCNQTTAISFLDSIPKQIFVKCTKDGGDLYSFTLE